MQFTVIFPEATSEAEAEEDKVVEDEKEQAEPVQSEST